MIIFFHLQTFISWPLRYKVSLALCFMFMIDPVTSDYYHSWPTCSLCSLRDGLVRWGRRDWTRRLGAPEGLEKGARVTDLLRPCGHGGSDGFRHQVTTHQEHFSHVIEELWLPWLQEATINDSDYYCSYLFKFCFMGSNWCSVGKKREYKNTKWSWSQLWCCRWLFYSHSASEGLLCLNSEQQQQQCEDYKVKFTCTGHFCSGKCFNISHMWSLRKPLLSSNQHWPVTLLFLPLFQSVRLGGLIMMILQEMETTSSSVTSSTCTLVRSVLSQSLSRSRLSPESPPPTLHMPLLSKNNIDQIKKRRRKKERKASHSSLHLVAAMTPPMGFHV